MKRMSFTRNGRTIYRVDKRTAYKAYVSGKPVYVFGNNENPESPYISWGVVTGAGKTLTAWKDFMNQWNYYQPAELGKTPYFYLEKA